MKKLTFTLIALSLLTACQKADAPSKAEINMAEMMGITVTELRNQTPEEHMQMMMGMKKDSQDSQELKETEDISALPEAKESEVLEVSDGDRITLNPTIVRKTINGKDFRMYGYNGQIPGPTIKVMQAATITVDVTNNIE